MQAFYGGQPKGWCSGPSGYLGTVEKSKVAEVAVQLFLARGFEATSVPDIARASGISRSTFFRQFRSKEDVVFADHDDLVERAGEFLAAADEDPWLAVCEAAVMVFEHYAAQGSLARQRYQVVNAVPALRDKELVTVFRYEQLFNQYLRSSVPGMSPLEGIRFTSAVVATNNYFLRRLMKDSPQPTEIELRGALDELRRLHGVLGDHTSQELVVAVIPQGLTGDALARKIQKAVELSRFNSEKVTIIS
ncbi:TetR family transcriptional regulator [Paenarthrobacter sp. NPDC090520]|uniref:TetR family transcriptional regulator n=1 Tax=Paenarthrobacter sp. NPDC090520 TaxID=3364382 RepID=UPI00381CAB98